MQKIALRAIRKVLRSKLAGALGIGWAPSPYRNLSLSRGEKITHLGTRRHVTTKAINYLTKNGSSKSLVVVLSLIPYEDSGGGQRATQLASQIAREGTPVLFINKYSTYEKIEQPINVDSLENVALLDLAKVSISTISKFFSNTSTEIQVVLEAPHPELLQLAMKLKSGIRHCKLVVESIDVWGTSLGSNWYNSSIEELSYKEADLVTATSKYLHELAKAKTFSPVIYIPNAVNHHVFRYKPKNRNNEQPPSAIYIGALWGDWIDFDAIELLAKTFPNWRITLIGSPSEMSRKICSRNSNVVGTGLVQNSDLPKWIENSDVCLAPFISGPVSQAVSPLKVFEYLSIGRPVAALGLPEISGMPGVYLSPDQTSFPAIALKALSSNSPSPEEAEKILLNESWEQRWLTLKSALSSVPYGWEKS